MTVICLLLSTVSALAFYLATAHQHFLPTWRAWASQLRAVGWVTAALSLPVGASAMGVWPGIFCALTTFMLVAVLLPYLDAWWCLRRKRNHVG